jgi:putative redox protein
VPAKLTSIAIIYRITGDGIDRESAEMAIDLALNKYCSVRDSLDPSIPIEWTLVLNETAASGVNTVEGVTRVRGATTGRSGRR